MINTNFGGGFNGPWDFLRAQLLEGQLKFLRDTLSDLGGSVEDFKHESTLEYGGTERDASEKAMSIASSVLEQDCVQKIPLGTTRFNGVRKHSRELLVYPDGGLLLHQAEWATYPNGNSDYSIGGISNNDELLGKFELIRERLEDELGVTELEQSVLTKIYWTGRDGPASIQTVLECPLWEEIAENYNHSVNENTRKLLSVLKSDRPLGKLILWQGAPGTGKTWAVRALMRELKNSHQPIIITDSNTFCDDISYYYSIIQNYTKPCLFILEDSAESILTETRVHNGHRTSKLLNLTDGLLAQGRDDLFLVSFNEDKIEIDPAFTRHGRCLGVTEFDFFNQEDAEKWLRAKGFEGQIDGTKYTLAELYSALGNNAPLFNLKSPAKVMGFRPITTIDSPQIVRAKVL